METAGNMGGSRKRQRKGRMKKEKKNVHFQIARLGGFEETQVICYLWDLVKGLEMAEFSNSEDGGLQQAKALEKQIRSRTRIEMRRYFFRKRRRSVRNIIGVILLSIFLISLFTCVLGVDRVNGNSMYPYFNNGDWIVYSRIVGPLKRNNVVVFEKNGENLVKRVAGLPGDVVEISASGGQVLVNGTQIREDYVTMAPRYGDGTDDKGIPLTVMDGQYFVLGDNRKISIDSRDSEMGTVAANEVRGRVLLMIRRDR